MLYFPIEGKETSIYSSIYTNYKIDFCKLHKYINFLYWNSIRKHRSNTHVNHPWLRLRPVFSRLSPLRGGPLRDPVQGRHVPLTLSLIPSRKKGRSLRTHWPYCHLHFHRSTSLRRTNNELVKIRLKKRRCKRSRKRSRCWSINRNETVSTRGWVIHLRITRTEMRKEHVAAPRAERVLPPTDYNRPTEWLDWLCAHY